MGRSLKRALSLLQEGEANLVIQRARHKEVLFIFDIRPTHWAGPSSYVPLIPPPTHLDL
jgi:hypothetical protein